MIRLFILIFLLTIPNLLLAAPFVSFQNIPFIADPNSLTTDSYINALYQISISLAAILVVLKLILAGTQYMLSDIVTSKQKAKDDIKGALLGLIIILAAITILNTINPNLTNINFLRNAPTAPAITNVETESDVVNRVRESSPNVISVFSGEIRSPEHQTWITECVRNGGRATRSTENNNQIECRTE